MEGMFSAGNPLLLVLAIVCFIGGGLWIYFSRRGKTKEQIKAEQRAVSKKFEQRLSQMNQTPYEQIQNRDKIRAQRSKQDQMADAAELLAERQAQAKRKKK